MTRGICPVCCSTVPATVVDDGNLVWIDKVCPDHGPHRGLMETSKFHQWVRTQFDAPAFRARRACTFINVTDRCDLACPNCYHVPDRDSRDPSRDAVVALAMRGTTPLVALLGAEPTLRDDLPELVADIGAATGKPVVLFTHGLRLANPDYTGRLADAGLFKVAVGLNLPSYNGEAVFARKRKAIVEIQRHGMLDHVSFSGVTAANAGDIIDTVATLGLAPDELVRVRPAAAVGRHTDGQMYLSQVVDAFAAAAQTRGLGISVLPFNNHQYALMVRIGAQVYILLRWPTMEDVDLNELDKGPSRGLLAPEYGDLHSIHSAMLFIRQRAGLPMPTVEQVRG